MRLSLAVAALVVAALAAPARADKKLDEAVTKAEAQLANECVDRLGRILGPSALVCVGARGEPLRRRLMNSHRQKSTAVGMWVRERVPGWSRRPQ